MGRWAIGALGHWRIGALGLELGFELLTYHAALGALLEVEAQLEQPLEVVDRGAARLGHPIEDVAPVDLGC